VKYPYSTSYRPPFPVMRVVLRNADEGLRTAPEDALLDTGSDGSLVPISRLQQILAPAIADTNIRSHWGEWRPAQLFVVDIELNGVTLPDIFVVGNEIGNEIVLGRNVLNKLRLVLDGPAHITEMPLQ